MSLPVVEKIAQDIYDTLTLVKEANSYHYDLEVERAYRTGNTPRHLKAVIHQDDPKETDGNPIHMMGFVQPFEVAVYIIPREDDTDTPPDKYKNVVWADIVKALMADTTRGGNAIDTTIRAPIHFSEVNGEFEGFVFVVDVEYRTDRTDPFLVVG